ncbi:hypothetical protein Dimus_034264 [Dionaea muscipula]
MALSLDVTVQQLTAEVATDRPTSTSGMRGVSLVLVLFYEQEFYSREINCEPSLDWLPFNDQYSIMDLSSHSTGPSQLTPVIDSNEPQGTTPSIEIDSEADSEPALPTEAQFNSDGDEVIDSSKVKSSVWAHFQKVRLKRCFIL